MPLVQPADTYAAVVDATTVDATVVASTTVVRGPALDPAAVAELQELLDCGPAQAIAEIGAILLDYAPPQLAEMRQALARQDAVAVARGAHALKSSSGSAAARPMAQLCGELERLGKAGELMSAATKLAEVEAEFARVEAAIKAAIVEVAGADASQVSALT